MKAQNKKNRPLKAKNLSDSAEKIEKKEVGEKEEVQVSN